MIKFSNTNYDKYDSIQHFIISFGNKNERTQPITPKRLFFQKFHQLAIFTIHSGLLLSYLGKLFTYGKINNANV